MKYNEDDRTGKAGAHEDDAIGEFMQRRRHRDYEEFLDRYSDRGAEDDYIGSRQSDAARRVISEGRVVDRKGASANTKSNNGARYNRTAPSGNARTNTTGNNINRNNKNNEGNPRRFGRLIKNACILIAALLVVYYMLMGALTADIVRVKTDTSQPVTPAQSVSDIEAKGDTVLIRNVLLLGIDDDGSSGSRSDTMMIASVNMAKGTVSLCSILRDNYVTIPGREKQNRINAAYAFGGAELALKTVEANFRLDIDNYVSVDMKAMQQIVDAIGGVEITITDAEAGQINRYSYSDTRVSAGTQRLDGKQAVCYARIRKIDSDFGRTNRQRVLIGAIVAQCRSLSMPQLMKLVDTVSPYLTTNMSSTEIATIALQVVPCLGGDFRQISIPAEGTYTYKDIDAMSVIVSDLEENTRLLHEFIYG